MNLAKVCVTKIFTFDSAHFLPDYVGKCAKIHGHTYKLEVTLKGEIEFESGMLVDFVDLKQAVEDNILCIVDHQMLNAVVDYKPTAENMVVDFMEKMKQAYGDLIYKIRLWETPTSYAEVINECYQ